MVEITFNFIERSRLNKLANFTQITFFSDKLNILLVILSAVLAFIFPLELFLITYAILGPLHYVTEINWLHKKNYFFTSKNNLWLIIAIVASLIIFVPKLYLKYFTDLSVLRGSMIFINEWSNSAIFTTLILAIAYQFRLSKKGWLLIILTAIIGSIALKNIENYKLLIGVFVPTIIHVYLFTLIFMLYGAKKSKSNYGYAAVGLAIFIPILIINLDMSSDSYLFADSWKEVYLSNNFHVTPVLFSKFLGISDGTSFFFYESMELKLMMFISFIYCYHYLNWFSKTTVIKWHKNINKWNGIAISVIWLLTIVVYFYDITLGLLLSLFMGFLHVILEFPLNMFSIKELLNRVK